MEAGTKEMTVDGLREGKQDVLGVPFDLISYESAFRTIEMWRSNSKQEYITLMNPHSVLLCRRDAEMGNSTVRAGMSLPDGVGIILAARLLSYPHEGRVTGPALMLKLCDWGREKGYRHYFYGGAEGVAEKLARRLGEKHPGLQIAGTYSPPFRVLSAQENERIVRMINSTDPDIVWVGLGAPKQEKWMAEHIGKINATVMIGVGAAFDFHSGNVEWAPGWIRRLGLEWAYRLAQEPKRMWHRNLSSPIFLIRVICQRLRMMFDGGPT